MTLPSRCLLLSRRLFLTAAAATAAGLAAGCSGFDDLSDDSSGSTPEQPPRSPDDRLIGGALDDQRRVLAYCLAVRATHRELLRPLSAIAEHHRTHVQILGGTPSDRRARDVPSDRNGALKRLRGREHAASKHRVSDASRAHSGEFARVLAAIGASQAQHVYLLDQLLAEES